MSNGKTRFEHWLTILEPLFKQASVNENPALWLYQNDARTPLFMLEALAKMYTQLHDKKKFKKIHKWAKELEDAIGAIDYYDHIAKDFEHNAQIPVHIVAYLQQQTQNALQHVNAILVKRNWIENDKSRLQKIRKKINKCSFKNPGDEIAGITNFYSKSCKQILDFVQDANLPFTQIEEHVHEFRRKIRWLSIYTNALQGAVQLTDNKVEDANMQEYLTDEIVNSPYNRMPPTQNNICFLFLEKNNFYALSWLISKLGKLKDAGLSEVALSEALQKCDDLPADKARDLAESLVGQHEHSMQYILQEASTHVSNFIERQYLQNLISHASCVQ